MFALDDFQFEHRGHRFSFTSSGLFTLIDEKGESFYERRQPLFDKLLSHLLWVCSWLSLIAILNYFCKNIFLLKMVNSFLMALIFVHLFIFGCRLTQLLLMGGIKELLFPPLWERVGRKLEKKGSLQLLQAYKLDTHMGHLTNLVRIQIKKGAISDAKATLEKALSHFPEHPLLLRLHECLMNKAF